MSTCMACPVNDFTYFCVFTLSLELCSVNSELIVLLSSGSTKITSCDNHLKQTEVCTLIH